jgi:hypothetical protein
MGGIIAGCDTNIVETDDSTACRALATQVKDAAPACSAASKTTAIFRSEQRESLVRLSGHPTRKLIFFVQCGPRCGWILVARQSIFSLCSPMLAREIKYAVFAILVVQRDVEGVVLRVALPLLFGTGMP